MNFAYYLSFDWLSKICISCEFVGEASENLIFGCTGPCIKTLFTSQLGHYYTTSF